MIVRHLHCYFHVLIISNFQFIYYINHIFRFTDGAAKRYIVMITQLFFNLVGREMSIVIPVCHICATKKNVFMNCILPQIHA